MAAPIYSGEALQTDSGRHSASARIIGQGEMAGLIRGFDWSSSTLGPISSWSDTLVTAVNLLLASRHPMFLWWGPDLIQFYNDGYRPSIRDDKHPSAVGQRGIECWPEIWPIIGPQIDAVMSRGESTWNINQLVPINRNGKLEEVYWTYSYSPVRDKDGTVQGTLVVCSETTEQVLSERRLRALLAITHDSSENDHHSKSGPLSSVVQAVVSNLRENSADIPFAHLYLLADGQILHRAGTTVGLASDPEQWSLPAGLDSLMPRVVQDLPQRFGDLILPPWPEPVTRAYLLPLGLPQSSIQAVIIFGLSPRLPFDDRYQTFLHVVGARIAALLQSEIQRLELAQAAQRFSSLVEANPFGMVIGNLNGEIKYVNPAFLAALGFSPAEVTAGKVRWDRLTAPEYAAADAGAVRQIRETGRCDVYEKVFVTKQGRHVPVLIGASVIGAAGDDPDVAAFLTDLTPLKIAEEALRRSNEELEKKVVQRTVDLQAEILERRHAESSLRELTARLLLTQDEERRRMARELHDHAGQTLAALGMNLSMLRTAAGSQDPKIARLAAESQEMSDELSKEIRTLSYLLHPPLLDEVGLASALRWYVKGFSERSEITVNLDIADDLGRLPRDLELVIFRVVQESLTNIHRHSGSPAASIVLLRSADAVKFEISDAGKGIPADKMNERTVASAGVGVRGMEQRVRQFGGTLVITSSPAGTKVAVVLPLASDVVAAL